MAQNVSSTFTGTGQSASFLIKGVDDRRPTSFNLSLWGTFVGTVQLERSFDGSTWLPLTANGTQIYKFTAPCSEPVEESEIGVLYRLNCTAYTSGTINYRLSE
jgi:hypothetical protein